MDFLRRAVNAVWRNCRRLKITLVLMVGCWGLLTVGYPRPGEEIAQWWTAVYGVAKISIGICLAHITIELMPFVRLSDLLNDYRHTPSLPAALMFVGSFLSIAIIIGVIIFSVASIW